MKSSESKSKRVLIISAHADDHLGCVGTVLKLQQKGYEVYEIVFTNSSMGGDQRKGAAANTDKAKNAAMRFAEYQAAAKCLGVKKTYALDQPDLGLTFSNELMLATARLIGDIKPDIAFIPPAEDWHIDHRVAHTIARDAFKWSKDSEGVRHKTKLVLAYEATTPFMPDIIVDVTEVYDKKIKVMQQYASQFKSMKLEEYLSSLRGYQVRRKETTRAEAFKTIPGDLPGLLFETDAI